MYNDEYGRPKLTFKSVPDSHVWVIFVAWRDGPPGSGGKADGKRNPTYIIDVPGNSREWCRISTYGGKLSENVTQAICRDLLAEAMTPVEAAGYKVVLHVHDEIVVECLFTEKDRVRFEALMCEVPAWAAGFPIKAGCWLSERYIKG